MDRRRLAFDQSRLDHLACTYPCLFTSSCRRCAHCPALAEVRGLGSMIAAEFRDPQSGLPSAEEAKAVQRRALDQGLILLTCGVHGNAIRFLYPLTIPAAQFDAALAILTRVLSA